MKSKRKNKIGTIVLIVLIVAVSIIGIFVLKDSIMKLNKAKDASQNIITTYLKSKK